MPTHDSDPAARRVPEAPVRVPVNMQDWQLLTFLHWAYDADAVQALLPPGLKVQRWDGRTWIGVIPFRMANVRLPGLPPIPGWRSFAELNVRAYVTGPDGRVGIWFLGMVVHRLSFALALRSVGLPYSSSNSRVRATGSRLDYRFGPPGPVGPRAGEWFSASVEVGAPLSPAERTPLVDSLTARWTAFHQRGILWRTPVDHPAWPLRHATVRGELTAPLRWVGLPEPSDGPMVHFSSGVRVGLGSPRPA